MLVYCLGRTRLDGTQPWTVLHSQRSVRAGGTGSRGRGAGEGEGERSSPKLRKGQCPERGSTRVACCQLNTCVWSWFCVYFSRPETRYAYQLSPPLASFTSLVISR